MRLSRIGGLLLCFAGAAVLCGCDAMAKGLGSYLTAFQIAFVRYFGAAVWLIAYIAITRTGWPKLGNWRWHLLRGVLMVTSACFFYYGVTHLPLAIAAALGMSAPIYMALIGIIFLKERPSWLLGASILLGIVGSAVVIFGGENTGPAADIGGWIAGLLAPVTYAAAMVLVKHHADRESAAGMTLSTALVASVILVPLALPGVAVPSQAAWPLIVLIGFCGAVAFILLTIGLRTTAASAFAIVDYLGLLWAALFGFLFFAEIPALRFRAGGVLIIAGCALGLVAAGRQAPKVTAIEAG